MLKVSPSFPGSPKTKPNFLIEVGSKINLYFSFFVSVQFLKRKQGTFKIQNLLLIKNEERMKQNKVFMGLQKDKKANDRIMWKKGKQLNKDSNKIATMNR